MATIRYFQGDSQWPYFTTHVSIDDITDNNVHELTDGLSQATFLHSLGLHGRLSDDGLKSLGSLSHVRWLYLTGTNVTDEGVVHLKSLVNLEYLSLRNSKVTSQGARDLLSALPMLDEIRFDLDHSVTRKEAQP